MSKNTRNHRTPVTTSLLFTPTLLQSSSRYFPTDKGETPQHVQRQYTVSSELIMHVKAWWDRALQM